MPTITWPRLWIAVMWTFYETAHYGWNWMAATDAEMICDGISFLIFALAFLPRFPKQTS